MLNKVILIGNLGRDPGTRRDFVDKVVVYQTPVERRRHTARDQRAAGSELTGNGDEHRASLRPD